MQRLKASELPLFRRNLLGLQGGKCALCMQEVAVDEAVVDHCHTTGEIRGVLHRGCNAMLGHIENNQARHKLTGVVRFAGFLAGVIPYIAGNRFGRTGVLYPTHKTDDEKRLLRNKRARLKRAKEKNDAI